jgi:hypothetical protein
VEGKGSSSLPSGEKVGGDVTKQNLLSPAPMNE